MERDRAAESKGLGVDSKMGVLLDDPVAKEILLKFLPEIADAGPMLEMARDMTLRAISNFPQANISAEKLQSLETALARL